MSTPRSVRFVALPPEAMIRLLDADLAGASDMVGVALTGYFVGERAQRLWRRRLHQLVEHPDDARWIVRVVVATPGEEAPGEPTPVERESADQVVGYAGFHGAPDEAGMVEIGYAMDPDPRRRGYAKATVAELLCRAAAEPDVRVVRASISPDNAASLATIAGFGFVQVGEMMDDEDGLELLFEVPVGRC